MHELYELKETLCDELKEYGKKPKMNAVDLEVVDRLSHAIKNLDKIIDKYEEEEYSNDYSMARGRGRNARRDSMGRYSRENYSNRRNDYYRRNYSNDGNMISELRELMEDAPDERTRMEFEKFINKVEMM